MDGSLNSIKDIFDYDFRTNWFALYKLARAKDKTEEDKQLLTFILCAMAYKGKDSISQLLNIHYISTYANNFNFPEAPNFPPNLGNEMSTDPTADEVFLIFRNTLLKNVNYARTKHVGILHQTSYENHFANNLSSTAMFIREIYWPPPKVVTPQQTCMLTAILDQLLIHSSQAIAEVEALAYQWHWTRELRKFGMKVGKILNKIYDMLNPSHAKDEKKLRVGKHNPVLVQTEPNSPEIINLEKVLNLDKLNKTLFSEVIFFNRSVLPNIDHEHVSKDNLKHLSEMEIKFLCNFGDMLNENENGILLWTGITPRTDAITLLRYFANQRRAKSGSKHMYLLEAMASLWSYMKRLRRCLFYQACGDNLELEKELENCGDGNKHFSTHPEWILLELELDITIRPIQFDVANQMMKMPGERNGVMQLNMGEGKTSVIVPMLCCVLAENSVLCRVTVLEPMFEMNYAILSFALGGLLNKRVYTLPCKRDMAIDMECIKTIQNVYEECLKIRGVVLALPEHRLSFRLLGYDSILKKEIELGLTLLKTENWLRKHARDVLDESDELLNVKYQLVYTVGEQISIDGGEMRWISCQKLLNVVRKIMTAFAAKYPGAVELSEGENTHEFPHFRLLKKDCYAQFNNEVADKILETFLGKDEEKVKVKQFLTNEQIRKVTLESILNIFKENPEEKKEFLLFSGYLRRGILTLALSKRWRVEYGVDTTKRFRQMAVPFRAKDVPAESTEFGHPDLAIILTHLSYYYSGLLDNQLEQVLKLLKAKQSSESLWRDWVSKIAEEHVPEYFRSFNGLNLKDPFQKRKLFDLLRRHVNVIDFFLSLKIFPRESKQFPAKLVMTSWDLCYERQVNPVTGFSGTNDTRVLLPPMISQQDLPQLLKTNEEVEKIILQKENEMVKSLKLGATCQDILDQLKTDSIVILIDAGALMIDCGNEQVAYKWLETNNDLEAVLYFKKNELLVKTRNGRDVPFHLSSYQGRLDRCAVFLDDQHTRGTDIKFPLQAKACVTVGGRMQRSKLIQACMRMRNLGRGQSVAFYLSHEAFAKVQGASGEVSTSSLLEWTRQNTNAFNEEGLIYWAIAGRNYAQRLAAEDSFYYPQTFDNFQIDRVKELRLDDKAIVLAEQCVDDEITSLMGMYGEYVQVEFVAKIVSSWFRASMAKLKARNGNKLVKSIRDNFERIHILTKKRCLELIPEKKHFGSLNMEEEQEKELELEKEAEVEEERVKEQRGGANPAQNKLLESVKKVVLDGDGVQLVEGIMRLCDIFKDTTFWGEVQPNGWGYEIFATTDFITVISDKYAKTDLFLRPVEYLVAAKREDGEGCLLLLSPFEVNELMPHFRKGEVKCELHMFAHRRREEQSILVNEARLILPIGNAHLLVPEGSRFNAQLLLTSGSLYFANMTEQNAFARFLSLALRPWTKGEKEAFRNGLISKTGFMQPVYRISRDRREGRSSSFGFEKDPSGLAKMILMCRHSILVEMADVVKLLNEKCYILTK